MQLLFISLVILFVGYFCTTIFRAQTKVLLTLHGLLKTVVIGIILIEMVPLCAHEFGWPVSLGLFVSGWLLISLAEQSVTKTKRSAPFVVAIALSLHAMLDGVLFTDTHQAESAAYAVVLHRLPMGMLIACFSLSRTNAMLCLFGISISTVVGFFGAQSLPTQSLTLLQGLAGGSLLHVVHAHTPRLSAQLPPNQWLRLGMVLGAVGLALIFTLHTHDHDAPPLSWLGMSAIIMLMVFIRPNLQHARIADQAAGL